MGMSAQGVTAPVLGDGSASFTPGISERRGSTSSFYGADDLGTNSSLYSSGETVSATRQYDAFGNLTSSSGSSANPFGFAGNWGYQNDSDSGLMLLGHRYYDASTGRFLTRDPIKDGRNWYAYCSGAPTLFIDPLGLFKWSDIGAGVGGGFGIGICAMAGLAGWPLVIIGGGLIFGYAAVGRAIGARVDGEVPTNSDYFGDLISLPFGVVLKLPDVFESAADYTDTFVDNIFGPCPIRAFELDEQSFDFSLETHTSDVMRAELRRVFPTL